MAQPIMKHLDDPIRILSFSIGDLVGYFTPFFIGSLFDSLFVVPICGIMVLVAMKRALRPLPRFYAVRFLYSALPSERFNRMFRMNLPSSHLRLWIK